MSSTNNKAYIRFYALEPECFFSHVVHKLGRLAGYDMTAVHCAIAWDNFVFDFTVDGIGYYTIEEDEEHRKPMAIVEVKIDTEMLYERASVLALTGIKLNPLSLVKKMLRLPMGDSDLLCTDAVQIMMGDTPYHYTAVEYLISCAEQASEVKYGQLH